VPLDCSAARAALAGSAARLERQGHRAIVERARTLARLSRAPAAHLDRHRTRLHQQLRELRAAARRRIGEERAANGRAVVTLARLAQATAMARARADRRAAADAAALARLAALEHRRRDLDRLAIALAAHDPQRTLERGYALVEDAAGEPVTSAAAARSQRALTLRLHDGHVPVRPEPPVP
jgi:exodeoxyribonuclease VII large subunit